MHRPLIAVLTPLALLLAACGGSAGTAEPLAAEPTRPVVSTAPAAPVVMTKQEAGAYYLAAICPWNAASDRLFKVVRDQSYGLGSAKKAAKRVVTKTRVAAKRLDQPAAPWPTEVRKDVSKMVTQLLDDLSAGQAMTEATSWSGFLAALDRYGDSKNTPAQRIRLRLGLGAAGKGC